MDSAVLLSALQKFQEWERDYQNLTAECGPGDAADSLMRVLYDRPRVAKLIGGSNAPILRDAAKEIERLRGLLAQIPKCDRCHGAGWCWWNELDNWAGHTPHELVSDDTKYTCDKCRGTGLGCELIPEGE